MQTKILPWPHGVADLLGVAASTLNQQRAGGDCPKLYTVGPRTLLTTEADVMDWLRSHEVPPGYKARAATKRAKAAQAPREVNAAAPPPLGTAELARLAAGKAAGRSPGLKQGGSSRCA